MYFCADSSIGVAVAERPTGPFRDALGEPLVPFLPDLSSIDPMVFIDDDEQAYLYWGAVPGYWLKGRGFEIGTALSVRKLHRDMTRFTAERHDTIRTRRPDGEPWPNLRHIEAPLGVQAAGAVLPHVVAGLVQRDPSGRRVTA